jgi:poly(A) polymerase
LKKPSVALALGVLLHDVGKPPTFRIADRIRFDWHVEVGVKMAEAILARLRYPNDEVEQAVALVANHMRFSHVREMRESKLKRFLRMSGFAEHLELHRLDCSSSHGGLANYDFARERFEHAQPEQLRPARLLTGHDLIAAGYRPGPAFSKLLELVEDAQLEGAVRTREEALELVAGTHLQN